MESAYLLVIGDSPDQAENLNSLLRNSGINVRISFADTPVKAKTAVREHAPSLMIVTDSPDELEEFMHIGRALGIETIICVSGCNPEPLKAALEFDWCLAVNSDDEDQLIRLVQRKLANCPVGGDNDASGQVMSELEHRFGLLLDSTHEAVAYVHEGFHVHANKAYLDLLQVSDMQDISGLSILELIHVEQCDLKSVLREIVEEKASDTAFDVTVSTPSSTELHCEARFSPTRFDGEPCIQMILRARDAHARLEEELERSRQIDPLTGLINRRSFSSRLSEFIRDNRDSGISSAVIYLEPDRLPALRQELGLAALDSMIADLAQVVNRCIGPEDLASRFSDHGFALLVRGQEDRVAAEAGRRMIEQIGEHQVELASKTIAVSCSAGLVNIGALTHDADEALTQARLAFDEASQSEEILVRYKPPLFTIAGDEEDHRWVERIRYALNNQELYSIQQSIVNLEGESEGLFEARTLMRDDKGDWQPEEYLPAAERHELASTIDRQVIPGLLKAMSGSGDRHVINLSSNSLHDFSFPSWFEHQLLEQDVVGSQVILQFSADAAARDPGAARRLIDELKGQGCTFAICDFDARASRNRLLGQLDVTMVKLRSGLARGIAGNPDHLQVVKNVVCEAENAQAEVVADEVMDATDLAVLWQCGVKLVAGDFLKESPQVVGQ